MDGEVTVLLGAQSLIKGAPGVLPGTALSASP